MVVLDVVVELVFGMEVVLGVVVAVDDVDGGGGGVVVVLGEVGNGVVVVVKVVVGVVGSGVEVEVVLGVVGEVVLGVVVKVVVDVVGSGVVVEVAVGVVVVVKVVVDVEVKVVVGVVGSGVEVEVVLGVVVEVVLDVLGTLYRYHIEIHQKDVRLVKVVWDDKTGDSTWEVEDAMRDLYPHLFPVPLTTRTYSCMRQPDVIFGTFQNVNGRRVAAKEWTNVLPGKRNLISGKLSLFLCAIHLLPQDF
ncbi:hypothetical protein LR48_Vigan05g110900 [Vigna angularis]|uniref:Chromo domain-containing protein n=1 Tax=Phaseolus angularis TaxID=3914 RepID=A0A0L9UKV8_PHAAN|nr:hypothetical protein LR48_Vigan05g110900 [Vigna angularis]